MPQNSKLCLGIHEGVLGQRRPQRVHGLSVAVAIAAVMPYDSPAMATAFVLRYVHQLSPLLVVAAAR